MKINTRGAALLLFLLVGLTFGCASASTRVESNDQSLITAEDIENNPGVPIESIIARKVPGVVVNRNTDGTLRLHIRGATTILGDEPKPPLYVLNGLVLPTTADGALTGVDRHDIATIKVLKGPEAAIYGIDGANGVIVITTKKGGPPSFERKNVNEVNAPGSRNRLQFRATSGVVLA
jgi:TonB-dependent SusC/RagA subfamily outer membrane receptor